MIRIGNGTYWLVLKPGTKLTFEFSNPSFVYDIIPGNIVWNFPVPVADNQKLLNFPHVIELKNKVRLFKDWRIVYGSKELLGTFAIIKANSDEYECTFTVNGFPAEVLNKNLRNDVDWSDANVSFIGNTAAELLNFAKDSVTKTWPEINFNFPPNKNLNFYGEPDSDGNPNPSFPGVLNAWDMNAQEFPVNYNDGAEIHNITAINPWLYLCYMLKRVFSTFGYKATGSIFTDERIKKILVFSNYAQDKGRRMFSPIVGVNNQAINQPDIMAGPTLIQFNDEVSSGFQDLDNNWDSGTFRYTVPYEMDIRIAVNLQFSGLEPGPPGSQSAIQVIAFVDGVPHGPLSQIQFTQDSPDFLFQYTYQDIHFMAGQVIEMYCIYFDYVSFPALAIPSNFTVTGSIDITNASGFLLNIYEPNILAKNLVPDISIKDFLVSVRKAFNLRFDFLFNQKTVQIEFAETVFAKLAIDITNKAANKYKSEPIDTTGFLFGWNFSGDDLASDNFTDLSALNLVGEYPNREALPFPALNDLALIKNINKYVKGEYVTGILQWVDFSDNIFDYKVADGSTEVRPTASPMLMTQTGLVNGFGIIPHSQMKGSTPTFTTGLNPFPLKFAIWQGMQQGKDGKLYPLASSYNYDYAGNIIGNFSLRWDDVNYGPYKHCWKKWVPFILSTEAVFRNYKYSFEDIAAFTFEQMRRVLYVESVVRKLTADLHTATGNIETEMETMKNL